MFYRMCRGLCTFLTRILFRVRVVGRENIPAAQGYLLAANHRSNLDPVLVVQGPREQVHFMAKAELFAFGWSAWLFRHLGAFPVKRGTGGGEALEQAGQLLRDGKVVGMFPEGTRSHGEMPLRPKAGVAILAMRTGADVLPCAVFFGSRLRFRSAIEIRYGRLIKNDELGFTGTESKQELKDAGRRIMDAIVALMEEKR